jgi:hypothetical protein
VIVHGPHALLDHPAFTAGVASTRGSSLSAERVAREADDPLPRRRLVPFRPRARRRPARRLERAPQEASYRAGRDLFRAVERDLGAPAVDRLIGSLFARDATPHLLPLLRDAYARAKSPHPSSRASSARSAKPPRPAAAPAARSHPRRPPGDPPAGRESRSVHRWSGRMLAYLQSRTAAKDTGTAGSWYETRRTARLRFACNTSGMPTD